MKKRFYGISRQIYLATMCWCAQMKMRREWTHNIACWCFSDSFLLDPCLAWCRFFVSALDGCTLWLSVNSEKDRQMNRQSGRAGVTLMIMYVSANGWCNNTYGLRFECSSHGFFCSFAESHVAYALFSTKTNEQSNSIDSRAKKQSNPPEHTTMKTKATKTLPFFFFLMLCVLLKFIHEYYTRTQHKQIRQHRPRKMESLV